MSGDPQNVNNNPLNASTAEEGNPFILPSSASNSSSIAKQNNSKGKAVASKQNPKVNTKKNKSVKPRTTTTTNKKKQSKISLPLIQSSSTSSSDSETSDDDTSSSSSNGSIKKYKKQIKEMQKTIEKLQKKVTKSKNKKKTKKRKRIVTSDETSEDDDSFSSSKQRKLLHNSGLKAGDNLSDIIRRKIWRHKYVDFHNILYPHQEDSFKLAINTKNTASLEIAPKKKRQLSEREWSSAFDDFVSIYIRKHPEDMQDLMSYSKFIKKLMAAGDNWHFYDYHFRVDREHSLCNWSHIRIDLQIDAARYKTVSSDFATAYGSNTSRLGQVPKGYCFHFHAKNSVCRKGRVCTFRHNCPRCAVLHPAYTDCTPKQNHLRDSAADKAMGNSRGNNLQNSSQKPDNQFFPSRTGLSHQAGSFGQNAQRISK